jgi:obg-like ATPase 1
LTSKPVIYLVNLSSSDYKKKKNKWLPKIAEWVKANVNGQIIPYSADFEKELYENKVDLKSIKADEPQSMINKIIRFGFKLLDLVYFFTSGTDEVRCWTIREQTKAPQAAGTIHTDFEKVSKLQLGLHLCRCHQIRRFCQTRN